jgi:hypothetical protein
VANRWTGALLVPTKKRLGGEPSRRKGRYALSGMVGWGLRIVPAQEELVSGRPDATAQRRSNLTRKGPGRPVPVYCGQLRISLHRGYEEHEIPFHTTIEDKEEEMP